MCVLQVLTLGFVNPIVNMQSKGLMACFGSQAIVSGVLLGTTTMSKR